MACANAARLHWHVRCAMGLAMRSPKAIWSRVPPRHRNSWMISNAGICRVMRKGGALFLCCSLVGTTLLLIPSVVHSKDDKIDAREYKLILDESKLGGDPGSKLTTLW